MSTLLAVVPVALAWKWRALAEWTERTPNRRNEMFRIATPG
jgi:hypothetical protein